MKKISSGEDASGLISSHKAPRFDGDVPVHWEHLPALLKFVERRCPAFGDKPVAAGPHDQQQSYWSYFFFFFYENFCGISKDTQIASN